MQALNERERRFVLAFVNQGRQWRDGNFEPDQGAAARAAGYGTVDSTNEYFRVQGHRVAHRADVQEAILEFSRKDVNIAAAVIATPVTISIAMDTDLPARDRLRACEMLFNRGGMPAQTEHKVTVEHVDDSRMLEFVDRLAAELGVDRTRLIGADMGMGKQIEGKAIDPAADE